MPCSCEFHRISAYGRRVCHVIGHKYVRLCGIPCLVLTREKGFENNVLTSYSARHQAWRATQQRPLRSQKLLVKCILLKVCVFSVSLPVSLHFSIPQSLPPSLTPSFPPFKSVLPCKENPECLSKDLRFMTKSQGICERTYSFSVECVLLCGNLRIFVHR